MLFTSLMVSTFAVVSVLDRMHALPIQTNSSKDAWSNDTRKLTRRAPAAITLDLSPVLITGIEVGYTTNIRIGDNPNDFKIFMDTGSSTFWVINESSQQKVRNHNTIGPGTSQEVFNNRPFFVDYLAGISVSGVAVTDSVNVGGAVVGGLPFGAATKLNAAATGAVEDGVMGVARGVGSLIGAPTVLEILASLHIIPAPIMGWGIGQRNSEVVFGGVNPRKFTGQLKPVPMRSSRDPARQHFDDGAIRVEISQTSMGNSIIITSPRIGILDTGTSGIRTPISEAARLNAQIPGNVMSGDGHPLILCQNAMLLSLNIGNDWYTLGPRDIVGSPIPQAPGLCFSNIVGNLPVGADWLIGIPFFKNFYVAMDLAASQVGLATLV
ncbi:acid protease [Dentipellis sp. KUC8613]|nr:acid protease [Dentipellis sp. KUC8613]